jgi:hypothetical protein
MDAKLIDPSPPIVQDTTARNLGRRDWLRAFAGLCGTLLLPPSRAWSRGSPTTLESWLQTHSMGDLRTLKRLGAAYLAEHPEERDRSRLSNMLAGEGTTQVRLQLIEKIARDWADHNVCIVEGWVLARSESRLCAALHLMDGPRT